ncbi:MAG TPA: LLM class flavin-dependent oxidoreductase [Burkholderiales bacterium]|nr:LLM class flavin-dependent oxidoreductase [Burkholderiales bacterium]
MSKLEVGIFDWVEESVRPPSEVYKHKLELAAAADRAGFHGYFLAEHQGTPLSIGGSPSLLLSAMFQRTQRLRAGALTFCLPWYNPYRFYNEICMLDHLSGGRLEMGVGRGVSPIESLIYGLKGIDESREKYREALEIFFEACRTTTLNYRGKHYAFQDAELHLKPLQQPYPPLWFPTSNKESIDFTASHGYHTAFLGKLADVKPLFDRYREIWEKHRNDPGRHNAHVRTPFLAKTAHLVIAETDAEAEKLGLDAYWKWAGHIHHLTRKHGRPDVHKADPYAEDSAQRLITGSPKTALERLQEMLYITSANYLLCIFSFGDLAPEHALRSLELFSREVMPKLKAA